MDQNQIPELSDEQRKEVEALVKLARKNLMFAAIKFCGGLFGLSILSFLVMVGFLLNSSQENQQYFMFAANVVNTIFMYRYLYGELKANSQMVDEKIKDILKITKDSE